MIELRHDCSSTDAALNPLIERQMATSVVYRLKSPLSNRCSGHMHRKFIWTFRLDEPGFVSCLAMLGCHDLDGLYDPVLGREIFDFNVTVNRVEVERRSGDDDVYYHYEPVDTFRITKDGAQKFYNLTGLSLLRLHPQIFDLIKRLGGERVQMTFQYHSSATDRNRNRRIICFAWCNAEHKRTAPLRTIATTTVATTTTTVDSSTMRKLARFSSSF